MRDLQIQFGSEWADLQLKVAYQQCEYIVVEYGFAAAEYLDFIIETRAA